MRDRERQRHRQREKQTPLMWNSILEPWDHTLSLRQTLNHWATQASWRMKISKSHYQKCYFQQYALDNHLGVFIFKVYLSSYRKKMFCEIRSGEIHVEYRKKERESTSGSEHENEGWMCWICTRENHSKQKEGKLWPLFLVSHNFKREIRSEYWLYPHISWIKMKIALNYSQCYTFKTTVLP